MTLDSILASYHNGSTPEEIAIQFSVLRLEDIYSAIAYYLNHRQEIDSYLETTRPTSSTTETTTNPKTQLSRFKTAACLLVISQKESRGKVRLLTDENFNGAILRGLVRRLPELDIIRVQDVGLMNTDDPDILEWAANEGRILLTHDVATITMYAYNRVNQGLPMTGVVEVILKSTHW
ncbi:MAG UNVERIFIED_CONTAM: DUF5615 family PIN-like protein [Microcystis novacekii LVE1205-3]